MGAGMKPNKPKYKMCKHCKVRLKPGVVMRETCTGTPDFPSGEVVTMSVGGPGRLGNCLKCPKCGHTVVYES